MRRTIGEQLSELKNRSGLSLGEIARLAGYKGASSLQRYFHPAFDPEVLDYRTAQKLAVALEGAGEPPVRTFELMALTAAADQNGLRPKAVPVQSDKEMRAFIALYGCEALIFEAEGSRGQVPPTALRLGLGDPTEIIGCPPFLQRRGVFAFYMPGSSMRPRYNPGEVVFVDGRRPPSIGDDVLVIPKSIEGVDLEYNAIFGKLIEIDQRYSHLLQYDGAEFSVPTTDIMSTRRVMAAAELLDNFAT